MQFPKPFLAQKYFFSSQGFFYVPMHPFQVLFIRKKTYKPTYLFFLSEDLKLQFVPYYKLSSVFYWIQSILNDNHIINV